jgi:hypothetical protein
LIVFRKSENKEGKWVVCCQTRTHIKKNRAENRVVAKTFQSPNRCSSEFQNLYPIFETPQYEDFQMNDQMQKSLYFKIKNQSTQNSEIAKKLHALNSTSL